jgi:hypothetical protein
MIDWAKPVELTDGTPANVERVLESGEAIVSWIIKHDTYSAVIHPRSSGIRNLPPKPREWWANTHDGAWKVYTSEKEALKHRTRLHGYIHVREVIK